MMQGRLLGIAVLGAVLGGCVGVPLEHREPYKVLTVDMPLRQVYDNLNAYPYCLSGWLLNSHFDHYEKTFSIEAKMDSPYATYPNDLIIGKALGDSATELRITTRTLSGIEPVSEKLFLTRLQTGSCE